MKNHFRNLHVPICGIFCSNSVVVSHYDALICVKSSTNCDAHLAESLFQVRGVEHEAVELGKSKHLIDIDMRDCGMMRRGKAVGNYLKRTAQKDCRYWKKGSFTVEAAMIMPVVLLCLLFCIYGGMFLHDRVVLAGTAATAGHRGFRCVTENQSLLTGSPDWDQWRKKGILWRVTGFGEVGMTELYAQAAAAGRLMVTRQPVYTVAFGGNQAEISYQAETAMQWPGWSGLAEYLKISGSASESGLEPEELLRLVKALTADQKTDGKGQ